MLELKQIGYTVKDETGKKQDILKDVNLTFGKGISVITGPNGSGKSTLIKILMGFEKPTSGSIFFDGEDITGMSVTDRARKGFTIAFQQPVDGGRAEEDAHNHAHGIDPHIWTSPRELQRMAANAYEAIHAAWPDSTKYTENYRRLSRELQELDRRTAGKIARSGVKAFIIYHPALTYYARDYGIRQEAVETDGKEPSAKRLAELIRMARREGIRQIFYQKQFPASVVETIARDMDARTVAIDPLREEVIANIDSITDLITDVR